MSEGNSGNYVRIIQYGLYVNGYFEDGTFDGIFTKYMGLEVLAFRKFMVLPEYTEIADVVVIKDYCLALEILEDLQMAQILLRN